MTNFTDQEILNIFREKNDAGYGFSVGAEEDGITAIQGIGELLEVFENGSLALYSGESEDGPLLIVGDSNGPWAVEI